MKKWSGKRITYIVMGIIAQAVCLYPWLTIGGQNYNAPAYLLRMIGNPIDCYLRDMYGGQTLVGQMLKDAKSFGIALYVQLSLLVIAQFLMLIHLILNLLRKSYADILVATSSMMGFAACWFLTMGAAGEGLFSFLYPLFILMSLGFTLIGGKMAEEWNEAAKREKENEKRRKELKKEKRRRLRFDGRYSKDFYHMIWKNFTYNWKDYRLLTGAGTVSVGLLFVSSGMQELLSGMDTKNDFASGRGMDSVLLNFMIVFTVLAVFLITYILIYYLKNRMKSFGVLLTLGIRRKTLNLFVGAELGASIVLSVLGGLVFGNILLFGFRKLTLYALGGKIIFGMMTVRTYTKTLGMAVLVFVLAFIVTYGVYRETNVTKMRNGDIRKEKMPGRLSPVGLLVGIGFAVYALVKFSKLENAEGVTTIGLFLFGVYLILRNGWGMLLKYRRKQEKRYYGSLIPNNPLYHKFKKTSRYVFLLTILHICTFVLFAKDAIAPVLAPEPEKQLPYDYVCLANSQDDEVLEQMEDAGAKLKEFPMVRATTTDRTVWLEDFRDPVIPQGQNIGISESTYYELKKLLGEEVKTFPKLDAEGEKIYIVYQQDIGDNAKPIDYYLTRKKPQIFIGQPLVQCDWVVRDKIYIPRTIAGSETGSLIGIFREGIHENIVVFSDAYFESVKENWKKKNILTGEDIDLEVEEAVEGLNIHEWPNRLVLVDSKDADREKLEELLQTFKENHAVDEKHDGIVPSYYSKEETANEKIAERLLNTISNGFIMTILLVISIFILYMKIESEFPETIKRYEFLNYMGMPRKERIASLKKEIRRFVWMPLVITAVSVPPFTLILWKLRHFTAAEMAGYAKIIGMTAVIYIAVQIIALKGLLYYVVRKVEGNQNGR